MLKVTFLIDNCDREYFERDRAVCMQEAEDYGYTANEFIFSIDEDQCGYSLVTISEPDTDVKFRDEWFEIIGGRVFRAGYSVYYRDTVTGDVRVKYIREGQ